MGQAKVAISSVYDAKVTQAVPFFNVTEMARSIGFYVDGLGFTITKRWESEGNLRWCWLELGTAALMLQQYWKDGKPAGPPVGTLGLGTSVCLMCEDALAMHRRAVALGLQSSESQEPYVGNNLWVVPFVDPDGYRVEFESPTDIPEGTRLSEVAPS